MSFNFRPTDVVDEVSLIEVSPSVSPKPPNPPPGLSTSPLSMHPPSFVRTTFSLVPLIRKVRLIHSQIFR